MMLELVNRLLRQTIVELSHPVYEGTKPIRLIVLADGDAAFNQVFQGKLVDMYKVIFFVLEVNYPDFFELIGKRIGSQLPITSSNGQKEEVQTA